MCLHTHQHRILISRYAIAILMIAGLMTHLSAAVSFGQPPTLTPTVAPRHFDVIVYHAGKAGIAAAVAAASSGCSVLLADPAPLPAIQPLDFPKITVLQLTDIAFVHHPPGIDRITALTLQSIRPPDTPATNTPATNMPMLSCDIVIDASAAGHLLKLCGEVSRFDYDHHSWFRKSRYDTAFPPTTANRLIRAPSEPAPLEARTLLHSDSIACLDPLTAFEHNAGFGQHSSGIAFKPAPPAPSMQVPLGVIVPKHLRNLVIAGSSELGKAAGFAAAQALREQTPVQQLYVPALQQQLIAAGSSLIHVSDVPPDDPDFAAVQWWGLQGGFHGLDRTPVPFRLPDRHTHKPSAAGSPDHAARLDQTLSPTLARRWQTIAVIAGVPPQDLPAITHKTTRGDFMRHVWTVAMRTPPTLSARLTSQHAAPRINPAALPGTHPPGEVDNLQLAALVIRNAESLPGIVVDDCDAELQGDWQYSTHTPPYVGRGYLHDMNSGKGKKSATYRPHLPADGWYEVRLSHCRNIRRSTNTLITISHADGQTSLRLNQQLTPEHNQLFRTLGSFRFTAGSQHWVRIANQDTTGKYVIADAVQWIPIDSQVNPPNQQR